MRDCLVALPWLAVSRTRGEGGVLTMIDLCAGAQARGGHHGLRTPYNRAL
jgi:hypothetical protein